MVIYIMFICAATVNITNFCQSSEQLLLRAQKLCSTCQTIETTSNTQTDICNALKDFCRTLYMLPDTSKTLEVPVIESDALISELEGDELPEFPTIEEIGIYRPEDNGTILSPHELLERRRLAMLTHQHNYMDTRMLLSSTPPKKARDLFGRATTQLLAVNDSFKKLMKQRKHKKNEMSTLLTVESLYLDTATTFLEAHDAGSPYALKEVQETLFGPQMQQIIAGKVELHQFMPNQRFLSLCQDLAQRAYYQSHANAEELYCYSQLALADIYIKYYRQPVNTYPIENIMYEQACYIIARKLLQAHDMGHSCALKDAEDLMSRAEILSIIEQKKKQKIADADNEFATIWKDITMRKYHTQPLVDAQQVAASTSFSAYETPLPPCSSMDQIDVDNALDEPPIDELKE